MPSDTVTGDTAPGAASLRRGGLLQRAARGVAAFLRNALTTVAPSGHPLFPVTWVTPHMAAGPAPVTREHLQALREQGIHAILNLCEELCVLAELEQEAGFDVFYLPIEDEHAPDEAALEQALDWLDEAVYLGRKVYIHCRYGIGRTGTVLNAYLLRRGMGQRRTDRLMRRLRSRPANYRQWSALRRYGRSNKPLTLREPAPEPARSDDLLPVLTEYEALAARLDAALRAAPGMAAEAGLCGRDHARCCRVPPVVTLAEAAALARSADTLLTAAQRAAVQQACRPVRAPSGDTAPAGQPATVCPLLALHPAGEAPQNAPEPSLAGRCMLFARRPLRCRLSDLADDGQRERVWLELLEKPLEDLSRRTFTALAGCTPDGAPPCFPLPEVLSGRYVQTVFHALACLLRTHAPGNDNAAPPATE